MAAWDYLSFSCNWFLWILVLGAADYQIAHGKQRSGRRVYPKCNKCRDDRLYGVEQCPFRSHGRASSACGCSVVNHGRGIFWLRSSVRTAIGRLIAGTRSDGALLGVRSIFLHADTVPNRGGGSRRYRAGGDDRQRGRVRRSHVDGRDEGSHGYA